MKTPFKVSGFKFQVDAAAVVANFKLQTSNSKPGILIPVLGAMLLLTSAVASAQAMNDPTRPATGYAEADARVAAGGPVLQSVMITPTFRSAIINGEMVKLGGKFGSARLVKISESEVVLKDGGESQVLKLYPGIEKRAVEKPEARTAAKRQK